MGNNKVAVLSVSAIVLVAVVATVAVTVSNRYSQPEKTEFSTSNKNIKDFCRPTDYQATCESSLSEVADNTTDPKELVNLAFQVTIDHIKKAFDHSTVLSEAAKDSRTSDALENCRELLDYAIDDLKSSIDRLDGFSLTKLDKFLDDLKVWISATITYQETCLDGFENTTTDAAESMRKALNSSAELTSNILAIVINFDSALDSLNLGFNRKLLSEEYPSWISPGKRRLLQQSPAELKPNVTVAKDGSGDVKTIGEAVLRVNRSLANVMMIGDGTSKTKITGKLNYIDGTATFKTATVAIVGDGFIGKDLWIENSAGAAKHQAVALRVQSDKSVFYNVRMDGYQDTLYVHTKRQFYRECTISGTQNIVTAQGRKDRRQASAIILHNCTISADPAYFPARKKLPTFLGRPWKEFSRTFVLQSQLDDLIDPKGWLPWSGDFGLNSCFYTELDNRGPGADMSQRVKWKGVKAIDYAHAQKFTVEHFIQGNAWLPKTGVPFIPGLLPMTESGRIH
ncbi:pectinesterase [Musa troglodytarum]|uniref:Pectinesterase n=1 Tax=Musa troglodytarum TaxID=320322 RepID=A0A9E7JII7_9LILI|nr:pectinesterase [Musa troglodytarum]